MRAHLSPVNISAICARSVSVHETAKRSAAARQSSASIGVLRPPPALFVWLSRPLFSSSFSDVNILS